MSAATQDHIYGIAKEENNKKRKKPFLTLRIYYSFLKEENEAGFHMGPGLGPPLAASVADGNIKAPAICD